MRWAVKHWHRLTREVVDAPALEAFKIRLNRAPKSLVYGKCPCSLQGSWTEWHLKVHSNPNYSIILQFFSFRGRNFYTKSGHENIPRMTESKQTY